MARDRTAAAAVAAQLSTKSHIAIADVTDGEAVRRGCAESAAALGPIDILVNNAGSVETIPFLRTTPETFQHMFAVHTLGAFHTIQAVLPAMLERGSGRVVNVASIAGLMGAPYVAHYVTAKHALVGLTRALAVEYGPKGITFNAVCPGYTDTDLVSGSVGKIAKKTGRSRLLPVSARLAERGNRRTSHPPPCAPQGDARGTRRRAP